MLNARSAASKTARYKTARALSNCEIPKTAAIIRIALNTALYPVSAIIVCDGADIPVFKPSIILSKKETTD